MHVLLGGRRSTRESTKPSLLDPIPSCSFFLNSEAIAQEEGIRNCLVLCTQLEYLKLRVKDCTHSDHAAFVLSLVGVMDPAFLTNFGKLARDPAAFADFLSKMRSDAQNREESSDESVVEEQLRLIKRAKEVSKRERSLPPGPAPPPTPRHMLEYLFQQARTKMDESEKGNGKGGIRNTFIGAPIDFSTAPLSSLTRIRIKAMMVRKRHLGNYFLGRVITPANRIVAIQFAVEDPEGDAVHISIYHFPTALEVKGRFLDAVFPIGTMFIVREPTFKMPSSGGNPMIRVDSPSDLIFVNEGDPILNGVRWKSGSSAPRSIAQPKTFERWKALGDSQFKGKNFLAAAMSYSGGLKVDPSKYVLLLNRSMAYLRLEFFTRAWLDCNSVLEITSITKEDRIKALYRAGKAKYGLGRWALAKSYFDEALTLDDTEKECRKWSSKCDTRQREQEMGEYDVLEMYHASQAPGARIDVADYVGKVKVDFTTSRGGGRAVVATQKLKAGELLVVAKPFMSAFEEDFPGSPELFTASNLITDTVDTKCHAYLVSKIATSILGDPARAGLIYDLYAGPDLSQPPTSYPPTTTPPNYQQYAELFSDQIAIDLPRIEGAATFNCFSPTPISPIAVDPKEPDMKEKMKAPSALYAFPSLFNHSCVPNCTHGFFSDVIVIRALQDIDEGSELTLSYGNEGSTHTTRNKRLKKWFERCDCPLCAADRSDGAVACKSREEVMAQLDKLRMNAISNTRSRNNLRDAKRLLIQAQGSYKGSAQTRLPRVALFEAHLRLGNEHREQGDNLELIVEHIKAIKALGVKVIDDSTFGPLPKGKKAKKLPIETDRAPSTPGSDGAVLTCIRVATHFRRGLGDDVRAERWLRAARWSKQVIRTFIHEFPSDKIPGLTGFF